MLHAYSTPFPVLAASVSGVTSLPDAVWRGPIPIARSSY